MAYRLVRLTGWDYETLKRQPIPFCLMLLEQYGEEVKRSENQMNSIGKGMN